MKTEVRNLREALVRDGLGAIRAPFLSRRFVRAVSTASAPVKVNVGAGEVRIPGWLNTDVTWWSEMWLDLSEAWPIPPARVSHIYADNVIEHFPLAAARDALRHAFDALQPGGGLRLATPDAEAHARAYLDNPRLTSEHLARHRRKGFPAEHSVDMLNIIYAYHGHHAGYIFDWAALSAEMDRAGFVDVVRHEAGESDDPVFRGLETRAEPTENATELVVEGRKPSEMESRLGGTTS
jgi:predicted SAM-dependent methyltransferase